MKTLTKEQKLEKDEIIWNLQNKKNEIASLMRKIEWLTDMKEIDKALTESAIWQKLIK